MGSNIKSNMKQARLSKGLSLPRLSKITGINKGELSRFERSIMNPKRENREKIEKAIGASIYWWVTIDPPD